MTSVYLLWHAALRRSREVDTQTARFPRLRRVGAQQPPLPSPSCERRQRL